MKPGSECIVDRNPFAEASVIYNCNKSLTKRCKFQTGLNKHKASSPISLTARAGLGRGAYLKQV